MSRRSAKYPRRRHERKTMRAVGDAGPCGVIAALTQQRRKAILARDAGAAAGMGAEAIRCTAICNIWVFEGYRAAGYCAVSRAGSLETCGFKQTFWSLLGLRPKVTRARRRGILSAGGMEGKQTGRVGDKMRKKAGGKLRFPPAWTHKNLLVRCHRLDDLDFAAVVGTALRAHSVRQMQSTALGACHQSGSCQLPYGRTSLIASLLGYFSLRDCHVDTSLVLTA